MDSIGIPIELKPLQQCFILRMVGVVVRCDRIGGVGQTFHGVAIFQNVFAVAVGRQPPRSYTVDAIGGHEGVVEGLRDLMAYPRNVLGAGSEGPRRYPTRVVHNVASRNIAVRRRTGFVLDGVKPEDATIFGAAGVEERIGKEKSGDVGRGDLI